MSKQVGVIAPQPSPFNTDDGKSALAWALPKQGDWGGFDGTTHSGNDARPVMISGSGDGQRVFIIGSQYGYRVSQFDFGKVIEHG